MLFFLSENGRRVLKLGTLPSLNLSKNKHRTELAASRRPVNKTQKPNHTIICKNTIRQHTVFSPIQVITTYNYCEGLPCNTVKNVNHMISLTIEIENLVP